jgi:hypothetical protein
MVSVKMQKYENAKHFRYEVVSGNTFFPKRRAKITLAKINRDAISEIEFLDHIRLYYRDYFDAIEHVTFNIHSDYNHVSENPLHIAVIYLKPIVKIRTGFFDERERIAIETGWYPLITGSFSSKYLPIYDQATARHNIRNVHDTLHFSIGKIMAVLDASQDHEGTSILLRGEQGSFLLDTGFQVNRDYFDEIRAVFLSHFHSDHTGGVWDVIEHKDIPIFLSDSTFIYLLGLVNVPTNLKNKLVQTACIVNERNSIGSVLNFFPVFYAPGSYGMKYTYNYEESYFYFGDICLKNGFFNSRSMLESHLINDSAKKKYILLDTAMVGKRDYSIADDDPMELFCDMVNNSEKRNIVFISNSLETIMYTYIASFVLSNKAGLKDVKFALNSGALRVIRTMWYSIIRSHSINTDPFIKNIISNSNTNFVESHRLYPLSAVQTISDREKIIMFIKPSDLSTDCDIQARCNKSDIVLIGSLAQREEIPAPILATKPRSILRASSPDWSFHSSEDEIINFIQMTKSDVCSIYLFHNYTKVLKKFIKNNNWTDNEVKIIR